MFKDPRVTVDVFLNEDFGFLRPHPFESAVSLPSRDGKGRVLKNVSFKVFREKVIFTFQNSNEFPYVLRIVFKSGEKKPNVYYYRVYDAYNTKKLQNFFQTGV